MTPADLHAIGIPCLVMTAIIQSVWLFILTVRILFIEERTGINEGARDL